MSQPAGDEAVEGLATYVANARQMLFGGLVDQLGEGVLLVERESGRILEISQPACALIGAGESDLLGGRFGDCWPAHATADAWREWEAELASAPRVFDTELSRRDGSRIAVEMRVVALAEAPTRLLAMVIADRTATRAAHEALRESERFYRNVIDNSVDGFFVIDPQRRFVEVNDALCALFRMARGDFIGRTPLDFITDESRAELVSQMRRIETTDHRRYQLVAKRKDGSTFPILLNNTTHRDGQGQVIGAFGFITDLSEIMAAQQAVIDSERELRGILDNLQDTYYRTDRDGRIVRASKSVFTLLGYTEEEALGTRLADHYCTPEDRDAFLNAMRNSGGSIVGGESHLRRKDGSDIWVLTNAHFITDAGGNVVGVEGTTRDNTERRSAEQELRLAARVFADSGEGIVVADANNRIVSVNQAFCKVTGYSPEEVIGRNPRLLASGRHDREFYRVMWTTLMETGVWRGEVWNRRKNGEIFPEWLGLSLVRDAAGAVTHFVAIFSDISERKANEAHIEFLAHHDALTGLPNRVLLRDRVEQALGHAERAGNRVALLFIDLDRFKIVNDSLGHPAGDVLLREAARRLTESVRDTDTVSRTGGDEFLVVLADLPDSDAAARVAEKIMHAIGGSFRIDTHDIDISCSIGISLFPEDGDNFDDLVKRADTAMYHAKEAGRNAFRFHTERMTADALEQLDLQGRLRRALERDEFTLHYQPLIHLASGRVIGAEALLRWQDPASGLVPPGRFIGEAEHSGLIVPIGEWVLDEACREVAAWHAAGHPELFVAVNLSAIQFRRGDIADTVSRALTLARISPTALELELTESVMLDGAESVMAVLTRLKALGVRLSIDDFGTGYSSLAYLKRLDVDKLKIDQSFVRDLETDPDDAAIVQAVIQMARSLGLEVLAEGVETEAIAEGLRRLKCDLVQGYHFGRPMPAADFRKLIGGG